ncbi:ATPase [Pseudaminobacter arsenicus]|uniref:ATPase n=1 Tax=Borborobacter arsenicus TaxID=1851146 RepID=A0A432UZ94_9HYPH|nr:SRPBCC family protein [Pseudaminobacter arsenicus]RUM95239.1 ATPase [Pseudaminobacter arsenicus]
MVRASTEEAFRAFIENFGRWWPPTYTIGRSPMKNAVIEPCEGGPWYEIGEDGAESQWGKVLAFEPPSRLLLAWRIGADWQYRKDLLTEIEVQFIAAGRGKTRVELEHRLLENMGDAAEGVRETFESEHGGAGIPLPDMRGVSPLAVAVWAIGAIARLTFLSGAVVAFAKASAMRPAESAPTA